MTYEEQLQRYEWKERRAQILRRDRYRCQECKSEDNLNVHHKKYITGQLAWEYPDSLLITLCERCHKKEHGIQIEDQYQYSGRVIRSAIDGIVGLMRKERLKHEEHGKGSAL